MTTKLGQNQLNDYNFNNSMARQAIINGNFDVWQRGVSSAVADATLLLVADRWQNYQSKDGGTLPTLTQSRQALTSGDISNSFYYLNLATNGAGTSLGVNSYHRVYQTIENGTRYLCGNGKKVTVSFYAKSDIANKRLGISLGQVYGSGGSPTAEEQIITQTPITLTSSWTKYTVTFTTNTLAGKTFGTANDDALRLNFWYMWGTTVGNTYVYPSVTAETYVGSGNICIAQVQLCAGDVALPFMPKSFEEELRACQRYYEKSYDYATAVGSSGITGGAGGLARNTQDIDFMSKAEFKVRKRTTATVVVYSYGGTANKVSTEGDTSDVGTTISDVRPNETNIGTLRDSASGYTANARYWFHWTASAELL